MTFHLKPIYSALLASGITLAVASPTFALTTKNPCDSRQSAIHCAYITSNSLITHGKYIRVKEVKAGLSAVTAIYCASPNSQPVMNIPYSQRSIHHHGEKINWEFSQCLDENCSASKPLLDDSFTVIQSGKQLSSTPKSVTEMTLDPHYGVDCQPIHYAKKDLSFTARHVQSSLQEQLDTAIYIIQAYPIALVETADILQRMQNIASEVAAGGSTSLDVKYQQLKHEIDAVQEVSTLDGMQKVSGGSIGLQIGDWWNSSSLSYTIFVAATDLDSLGIVQTDVKSIDDATAAIDQLGYAQSVVNSILDSK
jgi:hypothetical protein